MRAVDEEFCGLSCELSLEEFQNEHSYATLLDIGAATLASTVPG